MNQVESLWEIIERPFTWFSRWVLIVILSADTFNTAAVLKKKTVTVQVLVHAFLLPAMW